MAWAFHACATPDPPPPAPPALPPSPPPPPSPPSPTAPPPASPATPPPSPSPSRPPMSPRVCTASYKMCQDTGCCQNDAFACFSRLNGKASCEKDRDICLSKGANKGEEWECEVLEPVAYSPFPPPPPASPSPAPPPPPSPSPPPHRR